MSLITLVINSIYLNGIGLINEKNSTAAIIVLGSTLLIMSEIIVVLINNNIKKLEMNN